MHEPDTLRSSALDDIALAGTLPKLEKLEITYLGRNGLINQQMKQITKLDPQERKSFGIQMNAVKTAITEAFTQRRAEILAESEKKTVIDVSLPGKRLETGHPYKRGSTHLVTHAIEEIAQIFERIGFTRACYPEVEWEEFAFEALNMPKDHPARDDFETFFIDAPASKEHGKMVLTPHTSNGQVREMLRMKSKPPIRMINIGKTYRPNWDITHTPMFHQFEGLFIDKGVTISHLKGTIDYFVKAFFGSDREIRLRPFHFQFTEPSFEIDITDAPSTHKETDSDRKRLFKSGWLELGGAGMVHPNVLKAGGIDPDEYSGWAFGFGVERTFMMKEGLQLPDLRLMYSDDIRYLEQF
ncbi:MAG: phenylalanine--tRNA ligase subunit alpha [Patescibacteria group bacterium]